MKALIFDILPTITRLVASVASLCYLIAAVRADAQPIAVQYLLFAILFALYARKEQP